MEAVMGLVIKYCGPQMDAYANCVQDNQKDWLTKCDDLKQKATECSNNHPAVQKINKECSAEFQIYDKCLKRNPNDVTVCVEALHKFMDCANKSAERIQSAYKTTDDSKPSS